MSSSPSRRESGWISTGPRAGLWINKLRSPWGLRDGRAVGASSDGVASFVMSGADHEGLAFVKTVLESRGARIPAPNAAFGDVLRPI